MCVCVFRQIANYVAIQKYRKRSGLDLHPVQQDYSAFSQQEENKTLHL